MKFPSQLANESVNRCGMLKYLCLDGSQRIKHNSFRVVCLRIPVVPHKAVAEVSKIGNL